eukprot:TRINITY_DN5774_c0_g1_i1.p1 TRINITY_DN5774_c0_g1~~TRINITY_DN5774_c0_g1_i1.p1  ORF type:complete len:1448 (+),score=388.07 TRINITY_DN5774_c0_g1_i1:96-4439(+)
MLQNIKQKSEAFVRCLQSVASEQQHEKLYQEVKQLVLATQPLIEEITQWVKSAPSTEALDEKKKELIQDTLKLKHFVTSLIKSIKEKESKGQSLQAIAKTLKSIIMTSHTFSELIDDYKSSSSMSNSTDSESPDTGRKSLSLSEHISTPKSGLKRKGATKNLFSSMTSLLDNIVDQDQVSRSSTMLDVSSESLEQSSGDFADISRDYKIESNASSNPSNNPQPSASWQGMKLNLGALQGRVASVKFGSSPTSGDVTPRTGKQRVIISNTRTRSLPPETPIPSDYAPLILPGNYTSLRIDSLVGRAENLVTLNITEDIYKQDFLPREHVNFVKPETATDHLVYSVMTDPIPGTYPPEFKALETSKRGSCIKHLPVPYDNSLAFYERVEKVLNDNVLMNSLNSSSTADVTSSPAGGRAAGFEAYPIFDPKFQTEFAQFESKHPQKKSGIKLGLIYCRKGQSNPKDMFVNGTGDDKCSKSFNDFLSLMGRQIDLEKHVGYTGDMKPPAQTYYDVWKGIEVIYHVAPMLNAEGHRRLIGNDIAIIFFLEEGASTQFDPSQVAQLGTVPQVFAVVQPVLNNQHYRLAFFSNINIKQFYPFPYNFALQPSEMKDLILTNMYNGLIMANNCPPMNRLYYVPRRETLEAIIANYPKESQAKQRRARKATKIHGSAVIEEFPPNCLSLSTNLPHVKPKVVFSYFSDAAYNGAMTGSYGTGSFIPGGKVTLLDGAMNATIIDIKLGKLTTIELLITYENETTTAVIMFDRLKEGTILTVKHRDVNNNSKNVELFSHLWEKRFFEPMKLYFDPHTFESHVHPHAKSFTQIGSNMYFIQSLFRSESEELISRTMIVYKLKNGGLWIHGCCALNPSLMSALDALGPVEFIVCPTPFHRADVAVYKKKYPQAKLASPAGKTLKKIEEAVSSDDTVISCESLIGVWTDLGVHVINPNFKMNQELIYQLETSSDGVALVFGSTVSHNSVPLPFLNPQPKLEYDRYFFSEDLAVPRTATTPGIGWADAVKFQQLLFDLVDSFDSRLSTYKGKRLEAIAMIHGPPVYSKAEPCPPLYRNTVSALRYKIALGPFMPPNEMGGNKPKSDDIIKTGFLQKANNKGTIWRKRYCVLTKDRFLYFKDSSLKECMGCISLDGNGAIKGNTPDKPFTIKIMIQDEETPVFAALNNDEVENWISQINQVTSSIKISNPMGTSVGAIIRKTKSKLALNVDTNAMSSSSSQSRQSSGGTIGDEEIPPNEDPHITQILSFWLAPLMETPESVYSAQAWEKARYLWFYRNTAVDTLIRTNYLELWEKAVNGELHKWTDSMRGIIALIILLDQFTRNLFRDTPKMFAGDAKALEIIQAYVTSTDVIKAMPFYYIFWVASVYLRSEDMNLVKYAISLYEYIRKLPGVPTDAFGPVYNFARNQLDMLQKFGRFPARNALLNRPSTQEELVWLKQAKYFTT